MGVHTRDGYALYLLDPSGTAYVRLSCLLSCMQSDMEARAKCILQCVCVCERSTVGIRCIEREGKRGRGKKKIDKRREKSKREGKNRYRCPRSFFAYAQRCNCKRHFLNFRVSARADQNPVRRTWFQKLRPPTQPSKSKSCSLVVGLEHV